MTMLARLDFNLAKDADGNDIAFKATFVDGATQYVRIVLVIDFLAHILNDSRCPRPSLVGSSLVRTSTKKYLIWFSSSDVGDRSVPVAP